MLKGVIKTRTIIDKFIERNQVILQRSKKKKPLSILRRQVEAQIAKQGLFLATLKAYKKVGKLALIAEIKKASPSEGILAKDIKDIDVEEQARLYQQNGAACISVLTQPFKFRGSLSDLGKVNDVVSVPTLRKDFIFDPYQIYEAKEKGASAILLMVMILEENYLKELIALTKYLGMDVLVEVNCESELEKALRVGSKIIGVNARNLKNLKVDLSYVEKLLPLVPDNKIRVAESGILAKADVQRVKKAGADAILVGTTLMKSKNIKEKIKQLNI